MKIILLENIRKVGTIGEIIEVKRGFARNYLIANQKALYASKENIKEVEKIKSELGKKDQDKKKEAKNILQNDIEIAPTFSRALPIIGDVLTENKAKTSSNVIFIFIINC